jgi:RNA polymerase sigma factor (sigma-70 family)
MASITGRKEHGHIRRCIDGDPAAWAEFRRLYDPVIRRAVYNIVQTHTGRYQLLEDVVAEVYEALLEDDCRRLRKWRGEASFQTYLMRVARNKAIDTMKGKARRDILRYFREVPDWLADCLSPAEREEAALRQDALREALALLSTKQQDIIRMRLEGKSLRAIANEMEIPSGTVAVENSRAIEKLRRILHDDQQQQGDGLDKRPQA